VIHSTPLQSFLSPAPRAQDLIGHNPQACARGYTLPPLRGSSHQTTTLLLCHDYATTGFSTFQAKPNASLRKEHDSQLLL
jgi:hypothetical protein